MTRSILLLMTLFFSSAATANCQLTVRVTSFPPYYIFDSSKKYHGLDIELSQALLKEAGCSYLYKPLPWKRGLQLLKIGGVDLMTGMSLSAERAQYIHFLGPMRQEVMALIVPKQSGVSISSLDDLKRFLKPIGIVRGFFYGVDFHSKYMNDTRFKDRFYVANSSQNNFNMLINNRLSAVVGDYFNIVHWLNVTGLNSAYEIHPFSIHENDVYFGLSKRNVSDDDMSKLIAANARLIKAGRYREIIDQYRPTEQ